MKVAFRVTRPLMPGCYVMDINPTRQIEIERVIFNEPATIVFWKDGTKTVVKSSNEMYDPEKGLAMAIAKKALGNTGSYYNVFRERLEEYQINQLLKDPIMNKNPISRLCEAVNTFRETVANLKIPKKEEESIENDLQQITMDDLNKENQDE